MKIYSYPQCGTCKKALAWLKANQIEFETIHIVDQPPSQKELKKGLSLSEKPINKFFNTSGQVYRQGNYKEKLKTMTEAAAIKELASHGKLIKRPLVISDEYCLVGFREEEWASALL